MYYNVYQIEGEGKTLFSKIEGEKYYYGASYKKNKEYLKYLNADINIFVFCLLLNIIF